MIQGGNQTEGVLADQKDQMKFYSSAILFLTLIDNLGPIHANENNPNQNQDRYDNNLERIREQSDAPTLILMTVLGFIFIISQLLEGIN